MRRWLYYHLLTLLDLVRLWPSVQQQVIIVAGICLPILMLLGLKNGHVAELRRELLTSPTGREVVFWSAQHGELLRPSTVDSFGEALGGVDLIIPELHHVVSIAAVDAKGSRRSVENVTLYSTRPGDPILAQYHADVLTEGEEALVLAEEVAHPLGIGTGDMVTATVQRVHEGVAEKATLDLKVKLMVPLGSEIGYADINLLTAMEQYVQGFQVRRFGWPAFAAAAADEYDGYLIFCEKTSLLTDEDMRTLRDRGFVVEEVKNKELAGLYGLLVAEASDKLTVYRLAARGGGRDQWQRLRIAPSEIARLTEADDVVVPWSDPKVLVLNGAKHRVIGFSIPDRTWLKLYLRSQVVAHRYDTDTFSVALPSVVAPVPTRAALEYAKDAVLSLQVAMLANATESQGKPATANNNIPAAKPATSTVGKPDVKQGAVEKPVDAKAKPAAAGDISSPKKPLAPPKEEPGAKQPPTGESLPTEEKWAGSKVTLSPMPGTNEPPKSATTAEPHAKQLPAEKPAEPKAKPSATLDTSEPTKPAASGSADPSGQQPAVTKPAEAKAKLVTTPDTAEGQKPATPVKVQSSGKPSAGEKPADTNAKPTMTAEPREAEKPPASAGTEPGVLRTAVEEAERPTAKAATVAAKTSASDKPATPTKVEPGTKPAPGEKSQELPLAVVPVDLLAYLHAFDAGRVEYDATRRLFVPTPREPTFERSRLYATTIDDVPTVVGKLKERQFAVMSQSTRISEIHQQDFSLQLLVLIVGAGVFLFGVVTVVTVLLDSTERKRGTIGILRVMGVPRTAVFYMVFLRAAVIGSLAAGLTLGLGYLAGYALGWEPSPDTTWANWKPIIKVIIRPEDTILVVAGALACCGLGSLIPAFRASRLDPFDAIVEGRFR